MALTPDAAGALIGELTRRIEALQAGRYQGRDKAGLAVVTVDGEGLVCDVTLVKSISRHRSDAVAKAVHEAVQAAQLSLAEAFEILAAEAQKLAEEEGGDE
jgi:hypothetical protein